MIIIKKRRSVLTGSDLPSMFPAPADTLAYHVRTDVYRLASRMGGMMASRTAAAAAG